MDDWAQRKYVYLTVLLQEKQTDGWDDFEVDEEESQMKPVTKTNTSNTEKSATTKIDDVKNKDTGWDEFDDWGDSTTITEV